MFYESRCHSWSTQCCITDLLLITYLLSLSRCLYSSPNCFVKGGKSKLSWKALFWGRGHLLLWFWWHSILLPFFLYTIYYCVSIVVYSASSVCPNCWTYSFGFCLTASKPNSLLLQAILIDLKQNLDPSTKAFKPWPVLFSLVS